MISNCKDAVFFDLLKKEESSCCYSGIRCDRRKERKSSGKQIGAQVQRKEGGFYIDWRCKDEMEHTWHLSMAKDDAVNKVALSLLEEIFPCGISQTSDCVKYWPPLWSVFALTGFLPFTPWAESLQWWCHSLYLPWTCLVKCIIHLLIGPVVLQLMFCLSWVLKSHRPPADAVVAPRWNTRALFLLLAEALGEMIDGITRPKTK